MVNANPEAYRETLVANANLSDEVADTYPISKYPHCADAHDRHGRPRARVDAGQGLLEPLTYDQSTGKFSA